MNVVLDSFGMHIHATGCAILVWIYLEHDLAISGAFAVFSILTFLAVWVRNG